MLQAWCRVACLRKCGSMRAYVSRHAAFYRQLDQYRSFNRLPADGRRHHPLDAYRPHRGWGRSYEALEKLDFRVVVKVAVQLGGRVAEVMQSSAPYTRPELEVLKRYWDRPLLVYAETGRFDNSSWVWEGNHTQDAYAEFAIGWLAMGVQSSVVAVARSRSTFDDCGRCCPTSRQTGRLEGRSSTPAARRRTSS